MNCGTPRKRIKSLALGCALLSALVVVRSLSEEPSRLIPAAKVDQSVIASLLRQGIKKPKVISHIDLTKPFATENQRTFVAVQENDQTSPGISGINEHGPIFVCLVKAAKPDCTESFRQQLDGEMPYHLFATSIVYGGLNQSSPRLLVIMCGGQSFNGDCGVVTVLYKYDGQADRFIRVFVNVTGRNNNQDTRFVERGPLQGDIIVAYPTDRAPYTYWVEVYREGKSDQYIQILRYRGRTVYNDYNPLAVSDSEMPEIMRHLGLWKPGDALPVPDHLPKGCRNLVMRDGEEWCK